MPLTASVVPHKPFRGGSMKYFVLGILVCFGLSYPPIASAHRFPLDPNATVDANTIYYLYFRSSPQEEWRFWAGYNTLKEAQDAEYEVKNYGYETFIKKVTQPK